MTDVDDFLERIGVESFVHAAPTEKDETKTTAVVVALPSDLDPIRLVGDGDKHATLLFFGDVSTLPPGSKEIITKALAQVTNIFTPFAESIVGTQRLGSDVPPALVAMLSGNCLSSIRDSLLINQAVSDYLNNATQYPSYTPHVTLGYPDYASEQALQEKVASLFRIKFDRLALWWGDEHIEYPLNQNDNIPMDSVAMSDDADEFFEHHGVKGMKWGVRRTDAQLGNPDGGHNGVKAKSGVEIIKSKLAGGSKDGEVTLSRKEKKAAVAAAVEAKKNPKPEIKIEIDNPQDIKISQDAVDFVRTRLKDGHEMSNREINEAINRAQKVETYNKLFAPDPNAELKARLEALDTQVRINEATAKLTPERISAAKKLLGAAETGFKVYNQIDGVTGGALGKAINEKASKALGIVDHEAVAKAQHESAKRRDEMLKNSLGIEKLRLENTSAKLKNDDKMLDFQVKSKSQVEAESKARIEATNKLVAEASKHRLADSQNRSANLEKVVSGFKTQVDRQSNIVSAMEKTSKHWSDIASDKSRPSSERLAAARKAERINEVLPTARGKRDRMSNSFTVLLGKQKAEHKLQKSLGHSLEDFFMTHGVEIDLSNN